MKERPILFSGPMIKAILEGRKTQTRRVVKPQPTDCGLEWATACDKEFSAWQDPGLTLDEWSEAGGPCHRICPYGQPGDRLWVRETWLYDTFMHDETEGEPDRPDGHYSHRVFYRASSPDHPMTVGSERWTPSIHMPRWASRITLEIVSVRVERVQDISEEDAKAEGVRPDKGCIDGWTDYSARHVNHPEYPQFGGAFRGIYKTAKESFKSLWNSINEKRGAGWNANPWVWVIEFKVVKL